MPLYDAFNVVEGLLWWSVAGVLLRRREGEGGCQRAARVGAAAFFAFGVTDWLEVGTSGRIPAWLWGMKITCGAAILWARYESRGWRSLRWYDREILFAAFCLGGVAVAVTLQVML